MTEAFSFLDPIQSIPGIRAGWVERIPNTPITGDRNEAMQQLRPIHEITCKEFAPSPARWWRVEQVHGHDIAVIPTNNETTAPDGLPVIPSCDGLITQSPQQLLSIYVADCGAIWLADKKTKAIGLLHSGKKGTEANILGHAVRMMQQHYGSQPEDITAVLSPCIRPPDYEIDFAADIKNQADQAGLGDFIDCELNTADDLNRFYSYRKELGKTGRMMAMIIRDF